MEFLQSFIRNYLIQIVIVIACLAVLSLILVILNVLRTNKLMRKYKRLMRGANNKNLEAMLYQQLEDIQKGLTRVKELDASHSMLNKQLRRCIQNVGIIRYNAFDGMGSNQSFSLALLDDNGDGFVITNLYGRSSSTTFAKPVNKMKSTYPLSDEEREALEQALG